MAVGNRGFVGAIGEWTGGTAVELVGGGDELDEPTEGLVELFNGVTGGEVGLDCECGVVLFDM